MFLCCKITPYLKWSNSIYALLLIFSVFHTWVKCIIFIFSVFLNAIIYKLKFEVKQYQTQCWYFPSDDRYSIRIKPKTLSKLCLLAFRKKRHSYCMQPCHCWLPLMNPLIDFHYKNCHIMGSWVIDSEVLSCVFLLGFIQSSDSKDVTKQQDPYEGLGIRVIIVYLCLFSFNGGS